MKCARATCSWTVVNLQKNICMLFASLTTTTDQEILDGGKQIQQNLAKEQYFDATTNLVGVNEGFACKDQIL